MARERKTVACLAQAMMVAFLLLVSSMASAQSAADKAAAEALFEKGKELIAAGKIKEGCAKLEGSQRLDAGLGTLLYLADCYEKAGRVASAWATFREAESIARGRNDKDRELVARQRAAALEPRLSNLWIRVDPNSPPDMEIRQNGTLIPRASWGVALPVDPGDQRIEAKAPGKKPFSHTVTISEDGTTAEVTIPPLEDAPATDVEPAAEPAPIVAAAPDPEPERDQPAPEGGLNTQEIVGLGVAGAGVVGIIVGSVFGLRANSKNDDSKEQCLPEDENRCNATGVSLREDAQSAATVATVAMGVGAAALGTGLVLYFTAPSETPATATRFELSTRVAAGEARLRFGGRF